MGHLLLNRLNQVLTRGSICLPEDLLSGGVMDDPTVLLVAPVSVQMGDGQWSNHLALVTSPFSLKQEAIPSRYLITQSSTFQAHDLLLTDLANNPVTSSESSGSPEGGLVDQKF